MGRSFAADHERVLPLQGKPGQSADSRSQRSRQSCFTRRLRGKLASWTSHFAGQQGVYPVLIDLLNHVQKRTGKRVIITSGHRCPAHNTYVDPSKENGFSKHQIGAEVDFYVQDMEKRPMEVIQIIMDYYKTHPQYKGQKDYEEFLRYDKPDVRITTKPWFNKEIFIKYQSSSEGRNGDNRHPYPYISLQVRYDRDAKERVVYDWKRANLGYPHD